MLFQTKIIRLLIFGGVILFGLMLIFGARLPVTALVGYEPQETDPLRNFSTNGQPGECTPWEKVNTNGFGLPTEFDESRKPIAPLSDKPFQSEEGFEVLVFSDQLYLGMEGDNALGARLWRTRRGVAAPQSQLDWEEVAADQEGYPFGINDTTQADHIDSLAEFQGWIYASLANRSGDAQGTLVFHSPSGDPGTWESALDVIGPGFGKPQNENFKDMQVFDDRLCGGTWNETNGAEVWCTLDGDTWQQKNVSGFGELSNIIIWSGHVFDGRLYFGVQNTGEAEGKGHSRIYRTSSLDGDPVWEEVFRTEAGIPRGNILGDLDGNLYISAQSKHGLLVYRSSSGDAGSWEIANLPGFEHNPENNAILADGAAIYNEILYLGVVNWQTTFSIWRSTGKRIDGTQVEEWELIPVTGIDDPNNLYVQLAAFNGSLYAWTSNPVSGQQVWRTTCGFVAGQPKNTIVVEQKFVTGYKFHPQHFKQLGNRLN